MLALSGCDKYCMVPRAQNIVLYIESLAMPSRGYFLFNIRISSLYNYIYLVIQILDFIIISSLGEIIGL